MEPINRPLLKENAKQALRGRFWMAMLICFVAGLLGGNWTGLGTGGSGGSANFSRNIFSSGNSLDYNDSFGNDIDVNTNTSSEIFFDAMEEGIRSSKGGEDFYFNYDDTKSDTENMQAFIDSLLDYYNLTRESLAQGALIIVGVVLLVCVLIWAVATVFSFLLGSFVGAPIGVDYRRYFMRNRLGQAAFDDLFSAFSGGHYMDTVKTLFATNIRIFGWSLLFYFPGLVKYYEYYFVSYIAAENPTLSKERVREISREMTSGHKWQIFILELSFLGWALLFVLEELFLALISCGLLAIPGALLIYPLIAYQRATYAELYEERREYLLMNGFARADELTGF